ncbi:MAG: type II CAAX endopeptidase family protein [Crocinitomicaceae bacterium]
MKEQMSPGTQVMMVLLFFISAYFIVGPLLFVLFAVVTDLPIPETEDGALDPLFAYTHAAIHFIAVFIMAILVFLKVTKQKFNLVFDIAKFSLKYFGIGLLAFFVFFFAANYLQVINQWLIDFIPNNSFYQMRAASEARHNAWFNPDIKSYFPFAIIIYAVLPAILEELIFRGIIMKNLIKMSGKVHFGVIVSSLLFAAIHMQPWNLLPMTAMAMLFGYIYHYSKDIRIPMLLHFINNAVQISLLFYFPGVMA